MISFENFFNRHILNEAIPLKVAKNKKLSRKYSGAYNSLTDKIFKGKDRLIYRINVGLKNIPHILSRKIDRFLYLYGYTVPELKDYIDGNAYKLDENNNPIYKNVFKIGKLLQKYEEDSTISVTNRQNGRNLGHKTIQGKQLLHEFKNDPIRKSKGKYLIVISRHPYDIAGASTDRNWTSCMDLGTKKIEYPSTERSPGVNRRFISHDISQGTLVAYLVRENELMPNGKVSLRRPLSRILIKPHPADGKSAYSIGRIYGDSIEPFSKSIKKWISKYLNKNLDKSSKIYKNRYLYNDSDQPVNFKFTGGSNISDNFMSSVLEWNNVKYLGREITFTSNDNGETINYDIDINIPTKMENIPLFLELNNIRNRSAIKEIESPLEKEILKEVLNELNMNDTRGTWYNISITSLTDSLNINVQTGVHYHGMDESGVLDEDTINDILDMTYSNFNDFRYEELKRSINNTLNDFDFEQDKVRIQNYYKQKLDQISHTLNILVDDTKIMELKPYTMDDYFKLENPQEVMKQLVFGRSVLEQAQSVKNTFLNNSKYLNQYKDEINHFIYEWFKNNKNIDLVNLRNILENEWSYKKRQVILNNLMKDSDGLEDFLDFDEVIHKIIQSIRFLIGDILHPTRLI